jgi:MFS family permease
MVGGLISVCMIIGPVIGAGLSSYGLEVPFFGAALVCACNFVFTYYCLPKPEILVEGKEQEFMLQRAASFDGAEHKLENLRKRLVKQQTHRDLSVLMKSAETEGEGVDITSSPSHDTEDPLRLSTQESDPSALPSPWTRGEIIAMGLVSMFNYMCFASISVLLPLLLSESKFGLTNGDNDVEGAKKVAEAVGYFYAGLGFVSAPVMVLLAPFLQKQFGMISTATIGAAIHGLGMFMLLLPKTVGWIIPCLALIGIGNGLVYPTIPAFLAAHSLPTQHTETLAVGQVFQQLASVVGPLASFLFAVSSTLAFVTAGGASYMNIFVLSVMGAYIGQQASGRRPMIDSKTSAAVADRVDKHIALKRDAYVAELQNHLIALLEERHYDLDRWRLQYAIKEVINTSFPFLRPGPSPEHEEDIRQLLKHLGHSDFNESVRVQEQNKMAFANMVKLQ